MFRPLKHHPVPQINIERPPGALPVALPGGQPLKLDQIRNLPGILPDKRTDFLRTLKTLNFRGDVFHL